MTDIYNNGDRPLIVVRTCRQFPDRGDTHGALGLAFCVAQKTGGSVDVVSDEMLEKMYPDTHADERLMYYFSDKGSPDFLFSIHHNSTVNSYLDASGRGVIVSTINENIADKLKVRKAFNMLCPHHLTPEDLAYEGQHFATEYAELPRPFIGVFMVNAATGKNYETGVKLARQHWTHDQATFFVVTSHRTSEYCYSDFMKGLREGMPDRKKNDFPVVAFDYKEQMSWHGREGVWNPYRGLIDQSDHIVMVGSSNSILSELMMAGQTVHTDDKYALKKNGHVPQLKKLFRYSSFLPLKTSAETPIDLTSACADGLIEKHRRLEAKSGYFRITSNSRS